MAVQASVIIPTRNGMPLVQRCLREVLTQDTPWPFEIIVVDSGSTDGTWELLGSLPVRRHRIEPAEFNHGRTRNFAAGMATGDFLVFTVQDAVPCDGSWLRVLVEACGQPGVAGSYGKQLPWPSDGPLVQYHLRHGLVQPVGRSVQRLGSGPGWESLTPRQRFDLSQFRNGISCMRRDVWQGMPFAELPYGEDLEWGMRAVRAGHAIGYEPSATIYHSHDRSWWYELKRAYADQELVGRLFGYRLWPSPAHVLWSWLRGSLDAGRFVSRVSAPRSRKLVDAARAPLVCAAHHLGGYLGSRAAAAPSDSPAWPSMDRLMRKGV